MSVVKLKCLIQSKLTLPCNHNDSRAQVYFILAAIYCLGNASNCSGKLWVGPTAKVTKIQRVGDKYSFHQFQLNRINIKILKDREGN